jgi:hypothetical protein
MYYFSIERFLNRIWASFAFNTALMCFAAAVGQVFAQLEKVTSYRLGGWIAVIAVVFYLLTTILFYLRGKLLSDAIRRYLPRFVPKGLATAPWWSWRDLWLDREIRLRRSGELWRGQTVTPGLIIFGPRIWPDAEQKLPRTPMSPIDSTIAAAVFPIFAAWFALDAITRLHSSISSAVALTIILMGAAALVSLGIVLRTLFQCRCHISNESWPVLATSLFSMLILVTMIISFLANLS